MTRDALRAQLLVLLGHIAPEADLANWKDEYPLREELDLDSVDFYGFILAIHKHLGIAVPEADYAGLATLKGCLDYLEPKVAIGQPQ
ncbi:MAG TPA: phosphopantetheine-binding protein [Holophagaceae bacterium]|nr:phosphopantetheine-binding protein [Holophagaceae bacterium]